MLSIILSYFFCSLINFIDWLQNHLLSCPFKALTGIDCPGCGFQRSLIAILQGDLSKSWALYPPTIPLLLLFTTAGLLYKFPIKNQAIVFKAMVIIVGNFVVLAYLYKMLLP